MSSSSNSSNFNEHRWVIYIQKTLNEDQEDNNDFSVTIFTIPKTLMVSDPDSYIPHQIAIGPYHHSRPELYEMERYKLAAAKRTQKSFQPIKIHHVVDHFSKFESKIRSSYNKFLDFNGETLAWMMVVDVCFLLEFLRVYVDKEGNLRPRIHNSILRDVMMMENQIPLFLLRIALEFRGETKESADELLLCMIMGMSEEISPLKMIGEPPPENISVHESAHFVDFLYNLLVPKSIHYPDEDATFVDDQISTEFAGHLSYARQVFDKMRMKFNTERGLFKTIISSKLVTLAIKLPLSIILNLPIINLFKQPLEDMLFNKGLEKKDDENSNNVNKPPLMEEISIPSVSELILAGVKFVPTPQNNIMTINFDESTSTFYLPTVVLEVNTRSVLRNLVAYETCTSSGPLIFTRYTEMMNGIIDTEEDARLLREKGIIMNHLKSDEEAADLWNGMSKSIKLTKVLFLDKTIEDVNKYYQRSWKVKVSICLTSHKM
ncbi:putative UPF0481 protein At3g02645 [Impatiens glandulifera]|uniref:putative UPF0481 protein At3g02645 n=1 Tax=Impatiens glandulifera TaxID=253017 RepID=UPI001FB15329|nr:putative UPF0481 protein At3g02645 [Impatiens glandulifera]